MLPSIFGENLFDEFFSDPFDLMRMPALRDGRDQLYGKHARNIMKTDVREVGDSYEVDIDLPGFKKDEIRVELKEGNLTISAAKGLDKDEQDQQGRYIRRERYMGTCSRSFYVGDLRQEDISAKFEDGILRLTMPKAERKELPQSNFIAIE
mgnify:CR=1 FL=1